MEEKRREYAEKLRNGESVSYKFITYNPKIKDLTLGLVSQYLAELHINHIRSSIFTFLNETINNAVKANLKRAYFTSQNLDLNDSENYEKHMINFNQAVANVDDFVGDLKKGDLNVQVIMQQKSEGLNISILNNTGMTAEELQRINRRLRDAMTYESVEEALERYIDTTEGGGLGLILTIILLKKSGINPANFKIESNGKITRTSLLIPSNVGKPDFLKEIEQKILDEIEMIPPFPDTIQRVLEICDNPDSDMSQVAQEIEKDPAMTADVLKIVNSAAFIQNQRIKSVNAAVTILGLKAIRQLTIASASVNVLSNKFNVYNDFWEHSFMCGFYAKKIVEYLKLDIEPELVYLGGLLHDLGKIVLYNVNPEAMMQIQGLEIDKTRTNSATLEEITLGISHAHIGAVVAENWEFSPDLVEMIRNHHRPFIASPEMKRPTSVIHLADALINIELKKGNYVYIDVVAFNSLGLKTTDEITMLHNYLMAEYEKQKQHDH